MLISKISNGLAESACDDLTKLRPPGDAGGVSTADDELQSRVAMLFSKKDWKRLNERLRNLGTVDDEDR